MNKNLLFIANILKNTNYVCCSDFQQKLMPLTFSKYLPSLDSIMKFWQGQLSS